MKFHVFFFNVEWVNTPHYRVRELIPRNKKLSHKSDLPLLFSAPTVKPVGSFFITYSEPTGLPVGARIINNSY